MRFEFKFKNTLPKNYNKLKLQETHVAKKNDNKERSKEWWVSSGYFPCTYMYRHYNTKQIIEKPVIVVTTTTTTMALLFSFNFSFSFVNYSSVGHSDKTCSESVCPDIVYLLK